MPNTAAQPPENKMGVMPIGRLLISMSLPIMISMLVQALYNVVDSIFVSRVSENALTAVSLAFPVQNLMIGVGGGTGVGINALLSRSLGEKNFAEANHAANNGLFCAVICWILFALFGIFFPRYFFEMQTSDPEIIRYGTDYLRICCIASLGLFGQIICERLLQSTGKTTYTMVTQGTGAIVNIILDPIMIFGLLGFPRMEVAGAALATVIGQAVALCVGLYLNITKNREIQLSPRGFRPRAATIRRIYAVGLPGIAMMSIGSIMTFSLNKILIAFTPTAAAVFGVYFKLQSFVFMPVFGLNNGMVPILAYNYGARRRSRMTAVFKLGAIYATVIMVLGFTAFQIFPLQLLSLFDASPDMVSIGVAALRTISYSFLFAGFCIITSSALQALGHGVFSLMIAVARQLVVLVPAAWLLSRLGSVEYVWLAFPIAEIMSLATSALFLLHIYRKVVRPIPQ